MFLQFVKKIIKAESLPFLATFSCKLNVFW